MKERIERKRKEKSGKTKNDFKMGNLNSIILPPINPFPSLVYPLPSLQLILPNLSSMFIDSLCATSSKLIDIDSLNFFALNNWTLSPQVTHI